MSTKTIQDGLNWHANQFFSGRFGKILRRYAQVVPVYLDGKVVLIEGEQELREALSRHREHILSAGVINLAGRFRSGRRVESGRYNFLADWLYFTANGQPPKISTAEYFCRRGSKGTRVEMIEYKKLAFPDAPKWHKQQSPFATDQQQQRPEYLH